MTGVAITFLAHACSRLVPFPLDTNVNTLFFQVLTTEFRNSAHAQVQCLNLILRYLMELGYLEFTVSKHKTIFGRCPGASSQTPSVYTAINIP